MIGFMPLGEDDQAEALYLGSMLKRYSRVETSPLTEPPMGSVSTAERILSAFSLQVDRARTIGCPSR
ncbi:hypothetical protein [Pseudomonas sp. FME51]|uniref:hypothetical protein n=1 Tax=Pseudomonas sp. FME51 TaxID=2742609 RepID=UPI001868F411|nr:hypothetical protein [Pseudomonas sp. FME51]